MTKKLRYLFVVALIPLFLGGCLNDLFEREDPVYEGDPVTEFKPLTGTVNEPASGAASFTYSVNVQLIGPHRSGALSVPFTTGGSAVAGTHYNVVTSSPVSIGANSSVTTVEVEILDSSLASGQNVELTLTLQDGDVAPSENLKTHTLTIRGRN